MDRLKSMEVFVKVVESGSFIAASEALNISRPMASKYVQRLEEELGVRLLNRTTRTVSMTEAGRSFYLRCQNIFVEIDDAVSEVSDLHVEPRGALRINGPISFGRDHLTRAVSDFQARYPDISVDLTLNDRIVDIVDEGFDLAVRVGKLRDSSMIARRLAPSRMIACAAPSYLATRGAPETPADLADHNCLIYAYSSYAGVWRFEKGISEETVSIDGDFRSNFGEAVVAAAVAGRGVILEPSFLVAARIAEGALTPILTDYQVAASDIHAVYPQSRLLPQKVRVFVDHLVDVFGPNPYWDENLPKHLRG